MTEVFRIDYPATKKGRAAWNRQYGLNAYYSGKHWSQRKKDAEFWHWQTVAAMRKFCCRTEPFERPVVISFRWDDDMDIDNHAAIGKMIVDGMKGSIIKDDDRQHLIGVEHYFHDGKCISVTVMEVGIQDA